MSLYQHIAKCLNDRNFKDSELEAFVQKEIMLENHMKRKLLIKIHDIYLASALEPVIFADPDIFADPIIVPHMVPHKIPKKFPRRFQKRLPRHYAPGNFKL